MRKPKLPAASAPAVAPAEADHRVQVFVKFTGSIDPLLELGLHICPYRPSS